MHSRWACTAERNAFVRERSTTMEDGRCVTRTAIQPRALLNVSVRKSLASATGRNYCSQTRPRTARRRPRVLIGGTLQ